MARIWTNRKIIPVTAFVAVFFGAASFIIVHTNLNLQDKIESGSKTKLYICPVEPEVVLDSPGNCPICGMALIEDKDFEEDNADNRLNGVVHRVNESTLPSVRTIMPTWEELPLVVEASGIINFDSRAVKIVRADLEIRNDDAALLRIGQNVILTDLVNPRKKMKATINQLEPLSGGYFQLVRVYLAYHDNHLLPGMKIHASIEAGLHTSLWVSKSAITELGQQSAVFLLLDGIFVPTRVHTGMRSGDKIELISGINENSVIAANASLLTDNEKPVKSIKE